MGSGRDSNFEDWLDSASSEQRDLLCSLHDLLLDVEPSFKVSIKWGNPAYTMDNQVFAYLAARRGYVQLGFYNGAQMDNPDGIIEGTGKRLRHVKVKKLTESLSRSLRRAVHNSIATGSSYSS